MYLAASADNAALGAMGAGGISLVLTVFLILGVKGEGKVRLKDNPAMITAFLAGTSFSAAGQIWAHPERLTAQGLSGIGVGTGTGVLGNVGVAAIAALLLVLMLCWKLTPTRGAWLALISAFVWPTAGPGSIWAAPGEFALGILAMLGGGS
ncbi:hypothetical protein [Streptomyces liangshanensis]|uniref:hypothetical protein n=1 Tax=Streptomyces liangshanensis TaxID=2717324 RepID=UPI0036D9B22D